MHQEHMNFVWLLNSHHVTNTTCPDIKIFFLSYKFEDTRDFKIKTKKHFNLDLT